MKIPMSTMIILFGSMALMILLIIRAYLIKYKSDRFQFELIQMRPGVNLHTRITGAELEFETELDDKTISIKSERLYRVKVSPLERLKFKLRGIDRRFIVTFQNGQTEPISPDEEVEITSRVLKQVNESRALDKALRGEFAGGMDLKKILMILGIVLVVVIAYVLYSGGIVV